MLYRTYGKTGLKISSLAMGGMRFERPDDVEAMAEIAWYMYEEGVNYFDTAPLYCKDKSEEIMGAAVKVMKRRAAAGDLPAAIRRQVSAGAQPFYVATKTRGATEAELRTELERSLKRLNVERIDFYHSWCIRAWTDWEDRKARGVIGSLRKAREEGLIGHVAASVHLSSADIERLVGEGVFEGLTVGFCGANFAYREAGLRAAAGAGLGLVVMNPLGGGVYWQAPEKFSFLKRRPGDDLVRGGLRFVLSHPEITAALVGVRNLSDARQAVEAVRDLELLSARELEETKGASREAFAALCTACDYCKDCPEEIPVSRLMETYNYIAFGDRRAVLPHLKYYWGIDDLAALLDRCTGCGQCEEACTQHLPIRERFEELRSAWDEALAERAKKKQ